VILVGLTGGIGSGKSSVSTRLATLGAVVVDADAIVHRLQRPGTDVHAAIVRRFGESVLDTEGHLVRPRLAAMVFGDVGALADLNAIVHSAVAREMNGEVDAQRSSDNVVVLDIPLLVENPRIGLCGTLVVDLDEENAVRRLVEQRGYLADDARARIAKQATRAARRAIADWIIDNSGDRAALQRQVDAAWRWMTSLPPAGPDAGRRR
jgi:dephospho-CoA kinase